MASLALPVLLLCAASWIDRPAPLELTSPDGRVVVTVGSKALGGSERVACYHIVFRGRTVIADSRLGLELDGGPLRAELELIGHRTRASDTTWQPVCGERATVRDHYRELVVQLRGTGESSRELEVTFRAYDAGVAIRYALPGEGSVRVTGEATEFRFTGDHEVWATYSAQGAYAKVPLSLVRPGCERPLVLQVADDCYAAVAEANLVDWARMKLGPLEGAAHTLVPVLDGPVEVALPCTTPWRVVILAQTPGGLLERNDLLLNLAEPCAIDDTSWIRPGKVIRDVTLTTTGAKACVDFAAAHGLQFVELDAGWYGPEGDEASDALTVTVDPRRSKGPLDLPGVIRYADQRGIGILLYVNRRALERQLDEILPLYRSWGVKGVKYGFVRVGPQRWTAWLHQAVRAAARHRLMVDVHDEYRPTGFQRTWPNLMTVEGVGGDEEARSAGQELTTLFTRMIAGPADHTVCYFDARVDRVWTHGFQLAKAVCFFSPWQFLYWYDRPPASPRKAGGAGGRAPVVEELPELAFFGQLPTVWDDTRVIAGRIGEYAVIARRRGEAWFVGCMNAGEPRSIDVELDFLDQGRDYLAEVYADDPEGMTRTRVRVERLEVRRGSVLEAAMGAPGGVAVRIVPAKSAGR